jgi:hypothetical protein
MLNIASDVNHTFKSRSLTLKDVMNDVDLCVWVADAKPGDSLIYYTGHLSRDRLMHSEGFDEPVRCKLGELGNAAWMLGEENWVHLVQRRVSYGCWDYIAVRKAEAPKLKPVYRIIQSLAREPRKSNSGKPAAAEVNATDGGVPFATGPPA